MMIPPFLLSKPALYVAAALGVFVAIWGYGRVQYNKGYAEMETKYNQCQLEFRQEAEKWVAEVERQQRELKEFELKKKGTVKRNWDVFKTTKASVKKNKEKTDEAIARIVPTATVRIPVDVVRVYNDAVEGSRIATGHSTSTEVPDYSTGIVGETVTFEAPALAKALKENIDAYNDVATRYSKLIDIVVEMEKDYGDYTKGPVHPVRDNGGDVSS